jgi:hypothetical protein
MWLCSLLTSRQVANPGQSWPLWSVTAKSSLRAELLGSLDSRDEHKRFPYRTTLKVATKRQASASSRHVMPHVGLELPVFLFRNQTYIFPLCRGPFNFRSLIHLPLLFLYPRLRLHAAEIMSMLTERDPLLGRASHLNGDDGKQTEEPGIGPLEISRSTRRGILAGTFLANFLSVSLCSSSVTRAVALTGLTSRH